MYRTAKHRDIVADPVIRYKPVESLPGIGPVYGRRLRDNGFHTADQVLAQYLALKRNEQRFVSWMSMASGANAHWATLCFNGLNEWYNTWGRDVKVPQKALTPVTERGSITNRMLLERKMMQFNENANEDRLRSLFSTQTISLVDIYKSTERPKLTLERLNKSNFNIAENTHSYTEQEGIYNSKKLPSPKSVNFKENVEFNAGLPKKTPISSASKRPISPILKSRSLTPEFGVNGKKPLNLLHKVTNNSKGSSMNNLNLTGRTNKKETNKAKSIENINGSNTFTRSKSKPTTAAKKLNLKKPEKLVCTCNYPYREVEIWTSTIADSMNAPRNIEEYIVEKQIDVTNQNFDTNLHSTPLKLNPSQNETESEFLCEKLSNNNYQWNEKASKNKNERKNSEKSNEEENVAFERDNSNVDNDSDISSDFVITGNEDLQPDSNSVTVDSRDLEDVKLDSNQQEKNIINLIADINVFEAETVAVADNEKDVLTTKKSTPLPLYEENYFDHSNEDSGLDVTPKSHADYKEFATETQTTDDECSTTPFENVDSRSETDTDTDRTFEVNDTTDAESGFHFMPSKSATQLDRVEENQIVESRETLLLENQIDQSNQSQFDDELKKSNIRLFCDMLSNDLEQLPMEKFRKLKLKILEMVYAEIDNSEDK